MSSSKPSFFQAPSIVWFRNDLRVHDHEPLLRASAEGDVLGVYCFDPAWVRQTRYGFPKMSHHRLRFLRESLLDLQNSLQRLGSDLLVLYGKPEELLPAIAEQTGAERVHCHGEAATEELESEQAVTDTLPIPLRRYEGGSMIHPDDLPFDISRLPNGFTSFRKKVETRTQIRPPRPTPSRISWQGKPTDSFRFDGNIPCGIEAVIAAAEVIVDGLNRTSTQVKRAVGGTDHAGAQKERAVGGTDHPGAFVEQGAGGTDNPGTTAGTTPSPDWFRGGETHGLARLRYYLFESRHVLNYKFTRNALFGADTSTKFSPWLAHGCLSPRTIHAEIKRFEQEIEGNVSTYWVIFELLWRDFFRFSAMKHGRKIFLKGGIRQNPPPSPINPTLFKAWATGQTGIPFIDANMRELLATGFMSNRGRQNVASFLSQNLNVDWRMGAAWFESMLLDYDVYSNWGNWAYNSTVGHDARNRYFNILKQARDYDPAGEYVRMWLPELATLPKEFIHQPWEMTHDQQRLFDVVLGQDYPHPVLNLEASYEAIHHRQPR